MQDGSSSDDSDDPFDLGAAVAALPDEESDGSDEGQPPPAVDVEFRWTNLPPAEAPRPLPFFAPVPQEEAPREVRVLLLDIDGVLNTTASLVTRSEPYRF